MAEWYFDLKRGVAVPGDERGPAKDLLGPYPSRAAAENWRATHDDREAAWDGEEGDDEPPA